MWRLEPVKFAFIAPWGEQPNHEVVYLVCLKTFTPADDTFTHSSDETENVS